MKLQAICLSGVVLASSLCGLMTSAAVTAAPAKVADSTTAPQKLANVKLEVETGHVINFRETEPGKVLISEQYNIDRHRSRLTGKLVQQSTLPDLYRKLAPSLQVPQELVAAQQRKTTQQQQTQESVRKPETGSQKLTRPQSLSNYEDWFLCSNYSLMGYCATNVTSAYATAYGVSYFESAAMAVNPYSTAHFVGKYRSCFLWICSWKTAWDITIQPRWAHRYYLNSYGSYHASVVGNYPYPHVHFAAMWRY